MLGENPASLITRKTGNWWCDERRNWCAYCGAGIGGERQRTATRDHVVPRAHKGRHVTIPCCGECNRQKGRQSLPEFMLTNYFTKVRAAGNGHAWPLRDLWLVMALAAVEQARNNSAEWPGGGKKG